jgi:anti-sigma factor RsiW
MKIFSLLNLRCHYTRARMAAFIRQEMPAPQRRYIAHHLRHCQVCQAHYERDRRVAEELMRELPGLGRPNSAQLLKMWGNINSQLAAPPAAPAFRWRYGAVVMCMLAMLMLPLAAGYRSLGTPVLANTVANTRSFYIAQAVTATPTVMPLITITSQPAIALHNTPDPTHSGY